MAAQVRDNEWCLGPKRRDQTSRHFRGRQY